MKQYSHMRPKKNHIFIQKKETKDCFNCFSHLPFKTETYNIKYKWLYYNYYYLVFFFWYKLVHDRINTIQSFRGSYVPTPDWDKFEDASD